MAVALSSSSTRVEDYSQTDSRAGTIGDLSSNNRLTAGDYYEEGLVGQNLYNVLDAVSSSATANYATTISAVQSSAEKAIEAANQAYAESKSEARNILEGLKPIALYAALGVAIYSIFKR